MQHIMLTWKVGLALVGDISAPTAPSKANIKGKYLGHHTGYEMLRYFNQYPWW